MSIRGRFSSAETFSSTLTSDNEHAGMGGIAMLTLSDTENNLHFILILQGLVKRKDKGGRGQRAPRHAGRRSKTTLNCSVSAEPHVVPIRVQLVYRQHVLREIRANITSHVSKDAGSHESTVAGNR